MKANHNNENELDELIADVSDTSKILKWKQITTVQWLLAHFGKMFPILQRYWNEYKILYKGLINWECKII